MNSKSTKGVILAGGKGTRLYPLTKVVNKHLLPVYNKPMIYYPLETLVQAGIKEIMIVTGPEFIKHFQDLLGDGSEFGCQISYGIQDNHDGIAAALKVSKDFVGNSHLAVILGDNLFAENISPTITQFQTSTDNDACIFLKEVANPERFGVAELDDSENVIKIEEKPSQPKTNLAATGLYLYTSHVYQVIEKIKPSARGELEITDVNNYYINRHQMHAHIVEGEWIDAGTFQSLHQANILAAAKKL